MIYLIFMRFILIIFIFLSISYFSLANNLAMPCYGCHGPEGNSNNNSIPSISGLNENYFINAFKEYKNKTRDNYLMHIISKGYSEKEIKSLANFFSKKITQNDK